MIQHTKRLLWRLLAVIGLVLAVIGAVLACHAPQCALLLCCCQPGLQARGWLRLEAWLLDHANLGPVYSPLASAWGGVAQTKVLACSMMAVARS